MWNNTGRTSYLKQQKSRLQDDLAPRVAAPAELVAPGPVRKRKTSLYGHPQARHLVEAHDLGAAVAVEAQRPHPQYMSPGSHVASGGKAMISAISSSTQATNGAAAR